MNEDRLQPVLAAKRAHVGERKQAAPYTVVESSARDTASPLGFAAALRAAVTAGRYALIAEIKKASPSKGLIRPDFDPAAIAHAYKAGGATCLSVLTDIPFFQGSDEHLRQVRSAIDLPLLRKDFVVDPYQVAESRMLGADCVLLIMAAVSDALAGEILDSAADWNLDVLVEVHNEDELHRAIALAPSMIGINNRNLKSLQIDIETSIKLCTHIPQGVLPVAESGLSTSQDLARLHSAGIDTFLIGESLLRHQDVAKAVRALLVDRA